ncbi:MAG: M48 family metallopeptidase [Verrucomicrobiota bacterium]|nr:M48 family metallopeptidase [Verrucomicrobiota bacterium]
MNTEICKNLGGMANSVAGTGFANGSIDPAEVPTWISGSIPPRRVTFMYRAGLVLTALAMVLLPCIYIYVIYLTVLLVWLWITWAYHIFDHITGFVPGVLYLTPIFAGCTVVFFMLKPFFAKRAKPAEGNEICLANEPVLNAYICTICDTVGAPRPKAVRLDCQANASVGIQNGLMGLFTRNLVLTIGFPLIAGLNTRQLAGVLAHEFGHFSQSAGLTTNFLIRSVNCWFHRVVYERDNWDVMLENATNQGHALIALMMSIAFGALWLTRKLLFLLMHVGHAISVFQSRQMEFDADYYDAQLAGSETFTSTSQEIHLLNKAVMDAFNRANLLWKNKQLVNDLPALMLGYRNTQSAFTVAQIGTQGTKQRTHWFDTHPSDGERAIHVARLSAQGVFHKEIPAIQLLTDPAGQARATTLHQYHHLTNLNLTNVSYIETNSVVEQLNKDYDCIKDYLALTGGVITIRRPLAFDSILTSVEATTADHARLINDHRNLHSKMLTLLPESISNAVQWNDAFDEEFNFWAGKRILTDGIKIPYRVFGLRSDKLENVANQHRTATASLQQLTDKLRVTDDHFTNWMQIVINIAQTQKAEHAAAREVIEHARFLSNMSPIFTLISPMERELRLMITLGSLEKQIASQQYSFFLVRQVRKTLQTQLTAILTLAEKDDLQIPAAIAFTPEPLHLHLLLKSVTDEAGTSVESKAHACINVLESLHERCIGSIVHFGQRLS